MRRHNLFAGSSYDRYADILLKMWSSIKYKYKDAQLHICYGWDLFDKATLNNAERLNWKNKVNKLMQQEGVYHHGRVGKKELKKIRSKCGILAYPTYFKEINCLTVLECMNDGLVPVTMDLGALKETAEKGILIKGDIYDPTVQTTFIKELKSLMGSKSKFNKLVAKCKKHAQNYCIDNIAAKWVEQFIKPLDQTTKVTIYTPTIRDGFWNIMASNLAAQTYKNFEWIIIDGSEEDRSETAEKYSGLYNLNIKYYKQTKNNKYNYSLSSANNKAIKEATGSLFVFLQDFVLLPSSSIEQLVVEHKRHPKDFIAPVDMYRKMKVKPDFNNKEDWFNGETDVVGGFIRKNIRIANEGFREAQRVTDFEQNFGAVATQTLRDLGGYYEFFNDGLGFDDTEIIFRAWLKGYKLWIDELNVATCLDHWEHVGRMEKGINRMRNLNDPRYLWMIKMIEDDKLPIIRDPKIDKKIKLDYTISESVKDEDCAEWMRQNVNNIVDKWINENRILS